MKKMSILFMVCFLPVAAKANVQQHWAACCQLSQQDTNYCLTQARSCQASYRSDVLDLQVNCSRDVSIASISCRRAITSQLRVSLGHFYSGSSRLSQPEARMYCEHVVRRQVENFRLLANQSMNVSRIQTLCNTGIVPCRNVGVDIPSEHTGDFC